MLDSHPQSAGLYVRVHGDHLILGRPEPPGPGGEMENDGRVRLTPLSAWTYGLSIKRHTGRWERMPFSGSMEEMVERFEENAIEGQLKKRLEEAQWIKDKDTIERCTRLISRLESVKKDKEEKGQKNK